MKGPVIVVEPTECPGTCLLAGRGIPMDTPLCGGSAVFLLTHAHSSVVATTQSYHEVEGERWEPDPDDFTGHDANRIPREEFFDADWRD